MARFSAVAALAVAALLFTGSAVMAHGTDDGTSAVVELTDDSFERLTQASTGATTGDWFIVFYAPWCGHCKNMMPTWEDLAKDLHGRINVAKVDVTANSGLGRRFGIRGFPTIFFLRQGNMYKYEGKRTLADFSSFAQGGFASTTALPIPGEPTLQDFVIDAWKDAFEDFSRLVNNGRYGILAALLLIGIGIGGIGGLILGVFLSAASPAPKPTRQREEQTADEIAATGSSSSYAPSPSAAPAAHRKAAKAH